MEYKRRITFILISAVLCCYVYLGWKIYHKNYRELFMMSSGTRPLKLKANDLKTNPFLKRNPLLMHVNCTAIIDGDEKAIADTKNETFRKAIKRIVVSDEDVFKWANNCSSLKIDRRYLTKSVSEEERDYPIAYIISIYKSLQSFEHLLRSIYHPQNVYCVHVDQKSDKRFQAGIKKIVDCFDNVFLPSNMTKVYYQHWTIVQASLNCMQDLIRSEYHWKYVINLCVFDHAIKTNLETVRMLKDLNGKNSATTFHFEKQPHKLIRYTYRFVLPTDITSDHADMVSTSVKKSPPPHNITLFTGSDYIVFKREAVEYMLNDVEIQDFFEWSKDTFIPDEMVWPTLQRMHPNLPGSVPGDLEHDYMEDEALPRFRTWGGTNQKCEGRYLRGICIYGSGDLQRIVKEKHLFANKLSFDVDPVAVECLAEYIRNKTLKNLSL